MSSDDAQPVPDGARPLIAMLACVERGDFDGARALTTADFVKTSGPGVRPVDFDGWVGTHGPFNEAMPDLRYNLHDIRVDGDRLEGRFSITGTHTGHLRMPQLGLDDVAPTGVAIALPSERVLATLDDGKVSSLEVDIPPGGGIQSFLAQIGHDPIELPGG